MTTARKRVGSTRSKTKRKAKSQTSAATAATPRIVAASADHSSLKICHWSLCNGSGMNAVAQTMVDAEQKLGLDSALLNIQDDSCWDQALNADVHVSHTHIPVMYRGKAFRKQVTKPFRMVGVFHGTPEVVFESSVTAGEGGRYAPSNSLMIMQHDLKRSHARVTFWERHKAIYDTMMFEGTKCHLVPMGIDLDFWKAGESRGKYQGDPSVWSGENAHSCKWPYDLLTLWPWVCEEVDNATLHCCYLPYDVHRYFFPWAHANGSYYRAHIGAWTYAHDELRRILKSVDHQIGLVKYGDHNRLSLEANAAGCSTISYKGNPYSSYWVTEGDQRETAKDLIAILNGEVEPRQKTPVPSDLDMARAMAKIYESIL